MNFDSLFNNNPNQPLPEPIRLQYQPLRYSNSNSQTEGFDPDDLPSLNVVSEDEQVDIDAVQGVVLKGLSSSVVLRELEATDESAAEYYILLCPNDKDPRVMRNCKVLGRFVNFEAFRSAVNILVNERSAE